MAAQDSGAASDATGAAATAEAWVPPSWEDVVREHGNRVYRLAYRLTGNAHDAEDLTQDVFVRVFRSLADYTPGTFEGWLHRITTNLFLDRMRRQQKIRFDALPEDTERLAGREASPEAVYAEAHLDADVEAALAALPPDFRAAVVLCDIEQLSYEEIAQTLGVKLGTVRSRISRGRAMLRAALADRAPRAGDGVLLAAEDEKNALDGAYAAAAARAKPGRGRSDGAGPAAGPQSDQPVSDPVASRRDHDDGRGRIGRRHDALPAGGKGGAPAERPA
ncbi:RNA polymerase sigma factor SigE [Frankia sp. AiPa1]|uniref:RNA polymerase sigma factor SigE n=1 Tax=Frankia sp. AiPa1 TaxID=573492 RepID=UPI00202B7B2C|nr:RNA polymerase sigma factor SigE [Frankia sp. AiPa1]